jgi:hypothetical protein
MNETLKYHELEDEMVQIMTEMNQIRDLSDTFQAYFAERK